MSQVPTSLRSSPSKIFGLKSQRLHHNDRKELRFFARIKRTNAIVSFLEQKRNYMTWTPRNQDKSWWHFVNPNFGTVGHVKVCSGRSLCSVRWLKRTNDFCRTQTWCRTYIIPSTAIIAVEIFEIGELSTLLCLVVFVKENKHFWPRARII